MEKKLVLSRIKTPDGTILSSYSVHDYQSHEDVITGEYYFIDGGNEYIRTSLNKIPPKHLYVYSDEPFKVLRESLYWATRGINGDQPIKYLKMSEMDVDHIEAILDTQTHISDFRRKMFKKELRFRKKVK